MAETWYKEDLDKAFENGCDDPECNVEHDAMILGVRCCYEGAPSEVTYNGTILSIKCCVCGNPMVEIVPASSLEFASTIE